MKRSIKKMVSLFMALIMILSVTCTTALASEENYTTLTYTQDGVDYYVKYYDLTHYEITNGATGIKLVMNYNEKTDSLIYQEYLGNELLTSYTEVIEPQIEMEQIAGGGTAQINYVGSYKSANKVTCEWATSNGNHHWYNISTSSPKYVKIGCVATYERKYTTYQSNLDKYMESINSCNANYKAGEAILGTTNAITLAAEIALIAAGAVITSGILVSILALIGAGSTSAIVSLANAYNDYLDVKTAYELLK